MTAWLLTWLWQGSALAAGVAVALRCAPRRNAATRHLIWCVALAALAWLGWASFACTGVSTAVPSIGEPTPSISLRRPTSSSASSSASGQPSRSWSAAGAAGPPRVYAVRDRCRPFPSTIEVAASALARSEGARPPYRADDLRRGAGRHGTGIPAPVHRDSRRARRGADDRRARSGDSSRACARAATRRLVAARADAVALGAVDPSGGAVRVARVEPRARDGVRRMGRCADRPAEGVRAMSRARCRSACADGRRPDAGARAHRQPARARSARRSRARHERQGATERVARRCGRGGVRDGDACSAAAANRARFAEIAEIVFPTSVQAAIGADAAADATVACEALRRGTQVPWRCNEAASTARASDRTRYAARTLAPDAPDRTHRT